MERGSRKAALIISESQDLEQIVEKKGETSAKYVITTTTTSKEMFRMNEFITFAHKIPYFSVTAESEWIPSTSGGHIVRTPGIINLPTPQYCPKCESKVHNHSYETVKIYLCFADF